MEPTRAILPASEPVVGDRTVIFFEWMSIDVLQVDSQLSCGCLMQSSTHTTTNPATSRSAICSTSSVSVSLCERIARTALSKPEPGWAGSTGIAWTSEILRSPPMGSAEDGAIESVHSVNIEQECRGEIAYRLRRRGRSLDRQRRGWTTAEIVPGRGRSRCRSSRR